MKDLSTGGGPPAVMARGGGPFGVNDRSGPLTGVCDRNCGPGRGDMRPRSSEMLGKAGPTATGARRPILSTAGSEFDPDHEGALDDVELRSSG